MTVTIDGTNGITFPDNTVQSRAAFDGVTTTTSATDVTLTSTSTQGQLITFTAADKFINLPDASTMTTFGSNAFNVYQNGAYNGSFKLSTGQIVYPANTNTLTQISLANNNANQSGWGVDLQPFGAGSATSATTFTAATDSIASRNIDAKLITSTTFVVVYTTITGSSRATLAVAGSISGTTVTFGTPITVQTSSGTGDQQYPAVCVLSSTLIGVSIANGTGTRVFPISVSGTTLTLGTQSGSFTADGPITFVTLSATTALVMYNSQTRLITFSGTAAPTVGSSSNIIGPRLSQSAILLDTNKVFLTGLRGACPPVPAAQVITVSAGVVSVGASLDISSTDAIGAPFKVSTTEVIIFDTGFLRKLTVSGSTITLASSTSTSGSGFVGNTNQAYVPYQVSTTKYVAKSTATLSSVVEYDSTTATLYNYKIGYSTVSASTGVASVPTATLTVDADTYLLITQSTAGLVYQFIDLIG